MNAAEALKALRARAAAFANVEDRIIGLQRQANDVLRAARQAGDAKTEQLAREANTRLRKLFERYRSLKEQWAKLVDAVPGLGVVPAVYAGAVIALAGGVLYVLARVDAEERVIRLLEDGELTPEQARAILAETEGGGIDFTTQTGEVVKLLGFALLGYLGWRVFQDARAG